jgi:hypothetical protein
MKNRFVLLPDHMAEALHATHVMNTVQSK